MSINEMKFKLASAGEKFEINTTLTELIKYKLLEYDGKNKEGYHEFIVHKLGYRERGFEGETFESNYDYNWGINIILLKNGKLYESYYELDDKTHTKRFKELTIQEALDKAIIFKREASPELNKALEKIGLHIGEEMNTGSSDALFDEIDSQIGSAGSSERSYLIERVDKEIKMREHAQIKNCIEIRNIDANRQEDVKYILEGSTAGLNVSLLRQMIKSGDVDVPNLYIASNGMLEPNDNSIKLYKTDGTLMNADKINKEDNSKVIAELKKLQKLIENFSDAALALTEYLDGVDANVLGDVNDYIANEYPFNDDFSSLSFSIIEWKEACIESMLKKLEKLN